MRPEPRRAHIRRRPAHTLGGVTTQPRTSGWVRAAGTGAGLLTVHRLRLWILMVLGVAAIGTLGYVVLEGWSVSDALYMTVITLTTEGFREVGDARRGGPGLDDAAVDRGGRASSSGRSVSWPKASWPRWRADEGRHDGWPKGSPS